MDDTISRQAAIKALYHVDEYNRRSIEAIKNLPSTERHGRWEQDDQNKWRCSICKAGNNYAYAFDVEDKDYTILQDKYCPNCGASMTEE